MKNAVEVMRNPTTPKPFDMEIWFGSYNTLKTGLDESVSNHPGAVQRPITTIFQANGFK
jgi:hypothetical protein